MKYSFEAAEKSTVKITIQFDAAEWADANNQAYLKNKAKYVVNGFRKGKVPKHVLERVYGKGVFYEEALQILYSSHYPTILEEQKEAFTAVGEPELALDKLEDDEVVIIATVPVKPEVKIGSYKGMKIKKFEYTVTDADVAVELTKLQERNARKVDVTDRAAQKGDIVTIDFSGSVNGEKFEGGSAEKYDLELGSGSFIPGFEDQIVGMNIGEDKDITVTFPENYQAENLKGKEAVFAIHLHAIKGKELPEVNDEFVKNAAACDTVEDYRKKTMDRLSKQAKKRSTDETENSIIEAICATAEAEIPQAMIESAIDSMVQNMEYRMMYQGIKLEDYLKYTGTSMADYRKGFEEAAKKQVLSQLVIEKIIKDEGIGATDAEVEVKIAEQAASVEKDVEEYKKNMDPRQLEYIKNDIIITKLFDFLQANNEMYVEA